MGKNAIVGQSGGPTSVINASLAGVFESCKSRGAEIVYGMCNGVAGLLEERVVDLSTVLTDDLDIELLKRTPSSFLGSCRYKLPDWHDDETVYKKLFAILEKLNIGYFFYIGGNDSMDTIGKLAEYGNRIQSDIRFMGVPKTIDNDLMVTDHTPGYGSAAKYIGVVMKEIIRDATVYGTNYVTVVEIMGRNAGWLTAAASLAKSDDCEGVDMICLPEVPFNVEHFIEKVRALSLIHILEHVVIDVPTQYQGAVMTGLGQRKAVLQQMESLGTDRVRLEFRMPSRGLFGYRNQFLTDTHGEGILNQIFDGYDVWAGMIANRSTGSLVSFETGDAVTYGLYNAQQRGTLLVGAGEKVYEGMVIGYTASGEDVDVNVCKTKHLTNTRASGSDDALRLIPVSKLSLEGCLEFLAQDELLEVTPENLRIRKQILNHDQRMKAKSKLK